MSVHLNRRLAVTLLAGLVVPLSTAQGKEPTGDAAIRLIVDEAIEPILRQHAIPGMVVAVTID